MKNELKSHWKPRNAQNFIVAFFLTHAVVYYCMHFILFISYHFLVNQMLKCLRNYYLFICLFDVHPLIFSLLFHLMFISSSDVHFNVNVMFVCALIVYLMLISCSFDVHFFLRCSCLIYLMC